MTNNSPLQNLLIFFLALKITVFAVVDDAFKSSIYFK